MTLLKKRYGLLWLALSILTNNLSIFILGNILDVYAKKAWYKKWYVWLISLFLGIILLLNIYFSASNFNLFYIIYIFFPSLFLIFIWNIQISVKVSEKLGVPGKEIYAYPYAWILCFIVPIIGWILLLVLFVYTRYYYIIKIFEGNGERLQKK